MKNLAVALYYCGSAYTSDRLYVANVTGEDFVRQAHMRNFDLMTYYCKFMDTSGPFRRQFDLPKSEYIDVLVGPIPSGLEAGPKTEYYQCYRAQPKSEYHIYKARPKTTYHMCYQARPEPKYFSCYQPDSNPNIIRATRPSGSRRSLGTTTKILGRINVFCEPNEPTFPRSYKSIRSINFQLTLFNVLPS